MYNSENDLAKAAIAVGGAVLAAVGAALKVKDIDKDAQSGGRDGLTKQIDKLFK